MKKLLLILMAAILFAAGCSNRLEAPLTVDAPTPMPNADEAETSADETSPAVYSDITVSVRRNAVNGSERAITGEEETRMVQEIVFDYMVKSAAWEGVEVSELEDCITLSFDWTADTERQSYYQYDSEGRHVLQAGEAGMYTIMSDDAYEKLMQLAGLCAAPAITVDEAIAMLTEKFGEQDADTGNTFSFGYVETLTVEGKDYYRFRISWLVDNDHLSYLTDYLVATDGSEVMEYLPEETVE